MCDAILGAIISALWHIRSNRTSNVSNPRCSSQASWAPGILPENFRHSSAAVRMSLLRVLKCPINKSECPPGAFVSAATTMSMPMSKGRWPSGVIVVLSAMLMPPAARTWVATCFRSISSRPGLEGVSTNTTANPPKPSSAKVAVGRSTISTPIGAKNRWQSIRVT